MDESGKLTECALDVERQFKVDFDMNGKRLSTLYNPKRFEEIARLHANAFAWKPQSRIPLGIHVVNPEHQGEFEYENWLNPKAFFDFQLKVLTDTLTVGSDVLPTVAINHLGEAVVPSMFGAELALPSAIGVNLQNVGPTPLPVFTRLAETTAIRMPNMEAGIVPEAAKMLRYYRAHLPDWVRVVPPMPSGPFSVAMSLRGSDFLLDVVDQPDLCHKLIAVCAKVQAEVDGYLRRAAGIPLEPLVTNFGIAGAGLRLGEDSIVNLSPDMIRAYCLPAIRIVNKICGGRGHVHFCSLPHSRFEHIYAAFRAPKEVAVVSSQFGFEYYAEHINDLQGHLAIESFYGDALGYVRDKYGAFKDWAEQFVPRFKNKSGLVLYCQVDSVAEGREIWSDWKNAHAK